MCALDVRYVSRALVLVLLVGGCASEITSSGRGHDLPGDGDGGPGLSLLDSGSTDPGSDTGSPPARDGGPRAEFSPARCLRARSPRDPCLESHSV